MKYTNARGRTYEIPEDFIANAMQTLNLSRMEAVNLWLQNHGKAVTEAKEEDAEDAAKPAKTRKSVPPRKENAEKRNLVSALASFLEGRPGVVDVEIKKPEREVSFKIGENAYTVALTCHRK